MLMEKNPENNSIVTIKLISGEEIVGKQVDRTIDAVTLAKPIQIGMQQVGNQMGLGFMPVLGSVDGDNIKFYFSGMSIRPVKTGKNVEDNYRQATNDSGLILPQSPGLIVPG